MLALDATVMLRLASQKVLLSDSDKVLGTHTHDAATPEEARAVLAAWAATGT